MKNILFMIILATGVIMATKQDKNNIVRPVYSVDSVEVLKAPGNEILLKTISTVPNPCYQFAHFETKIDGDQIIVTIFARIDKNVNCISVLGKMGAEIKIPVTKAGRYDLVFVGQSKNKEITVDVK